jgi:hypothetical protein
VAVASELRLSKPVSCQCCGVTSWVIPDRCAFLSLLRCSAAGSRPSTLLGNSEKGLSMGVFNRRYLGETGKAGKHSTRSHGTCLRSADTHNEEQRDQGFGLSVLESLSQKQLPQRPAPPGSTATMLAMPHISHACVLLLSSFLIPIGAAPACLHTPLRLQALPCPHAPASPPAASSQVRAKIISQSATKHSAPVAAGAHRAVPSSEPDGMQPRAHGTGTCLLIDPSMPERLWAGQQTDSIHQTKMETVVLDLSSMFSQSGPYSAMYGDRQQCGLMMTGFA